MLRMLVMSRFVSQKMTTFTAKENKEDLVVLKELIEAEKVTPGIDRTYPLSEVPGAIRYLEDTLEEKESSSPSEAPTTAQVTGSHYIRSWA